MKIFVEKKDNVGHPDRGKMEDFKIAVYEGVFNVTKSLGGWGIYGRLNTLLKPQQISRVNLLVLYT